MGQSGGPKTFGVVVFENIPKIVSPYHPRSCPCDKVHPARLLVLLLWVLPAPATRPAVPAIATEDPEGS